jgi:hypothetical protein
MSEEALYRPVHDYLEQRFQDRVRPAYGDLRFLSALTARAGGASTGIWSKPDLCFIALWRFPNRVTNGSGAILVLVPHRVKAMTQSVFVLILPRRSAAQRC